MKTTIPKFETCEQCDGYGSGPDCEEGSGIPYTCYACGATGRVPFGTAAAEHLAIAQANGFATVEAWDAELQARNVANAAWLAQRREARAADRIDSCEVGESPDY